MLRSDGRLAKQLLLFVFVLLALSALGGCRRSPEAKKARFMESGKAFMQAKDYSRAILQFRNAAQFAAKDPEPYYQLALAFLADGQLANGVGALNQALKVNAKYRPAQLKKAELETMSSRPGDQREAESTLQGIVGASPDDSEALSALALAEIRLGHEQDAWKNLEAALEKSPQNLKASVTIARLKADRGDLTGAEAVLHTAVQSAPKSADPLVALGVFYASTKRLPDAERTLDQALQIDPKNDAALFELAAVQVQAGKRDQAEQTYAKLSALPIPRYKPLHARFLYGEGKRDAAIAEFAKLAKDSPDDRTARTRLAAAYWAANRKAEAEKVLTDALKHNPKDVDALMQHAQIELATGRYQDAQTDADQVLRYRTESASAHYVKANVYRARGETALEQQELGEALRIDKNLLAARLELAQSLLQQHDGKAALTLLDSKEINDRQKASLPVFVLKIYALMDVKDYDTARKYVEFALAKVKTPDLLFQDAMLKAIRKDYPAARASLEAALKMRPEDVRALELLAKTYAAQKQVAAGTQRIREQAASQPKSARLQMALGDWLTATGDHTGALQAYSAAKQLDPQLTAADMATVRLYIAENKNDAARPVLTRILQTNNANEEAYVWMGVLEERARNYDAAISDYRKVLAINSNDLMALNNLAFLLADHGQAQQLDEALKLAQQVRALIPKSANVDDTMGWVYYKKGIYPSAVLQLEDAVARDKDANTPSALHHYHLAMAYLMAGKHKAGNDELEKARTLNPNLPEAKQAMTLLAQTKTASN